MALGILLGAWLFSRSDWPTVYLASFISICLSVADMFWGYEIAQVLIRLTYWVTQ